MSVKHLMLALCILGVGNTYAMNNGGAPQGQAPDWTAFFQQALNNPNMRQMIIDMLGTWIKDPNTHASFKDIVLEWVKANKATMKDYFDVKRQQYTGGMAGMAFNYVDAAFGGKSFPISDDPELSSLFTLEDWSLACARGDTKIIQHFLDSPAYAHLINLSDGEGKALFWAAAGYINADEIDEFSSSIDGFRALAQHKDIESDFTIDTGGFGGTKAFDEWILYIAEYPDNPEKQARLEAVKSILEPTLSQARKSALKTIKAQSDAARRAKQKLQRDAQESNRNKYAFIVGLGATAFALYKYLNRGAGNAAAQTADQTAAETA